VRVSRKWLRRPDNIHIYTSLINRSCVYVGIECAHIYIYMCVCVCDNIHIYTLLFVMTVIVLGWDPW